MRKPSTGHPNTPISNDGDRPRDIPTVAATIHIHRVYRIFTEGRETVKVEGSSVGECLNNLVTKYPDIRRVLFATSGDLLKNIDLYVNGESAYPEELEKPVSHEDDIYIHLLLTGG